MKMKHLMLTAAVGALMISGVHAQEFTLKYSNMTPEQSPIPQCFSMPLLKGIEEASGGRIKYEPYMGGTAFGNPTKQFEQVAQGVMDMSEGPLTYTPGRFALTEIATLPLLITDNVVGSIAMTRLAKDWLAEEFEDIHLMALILTTPYQFHMAKPTEDITNLNGARVRVSGPALTAMAEEFGGVPVGQPLPETYESMQRGVLDGAIAPWTAVAAFKLHEVSKAHIIGDFSVGLTFIGMSKKFYNALPDDLKEIVDTQFTGEEVAAKGAECFRKVDAFAIKLAKESGNEIIELSPEAREAASTRLKGTVDGLIADVEGKGKPAREFYEALQAEIEKVKAERR